MKGYSTRDVARMLDLSVGQVRSYARAGFIDPRRGLRGEYRFSFQDLVLLRTAKSLRAARIPPDRLVRALLRLKQELPQGQPLSAVQIRTHGERIVVRQGQDVWNPDSGQSEFNFDVSELAGKAAPLARLALVKAKAERRPLTASQWNEMGYDLEASAPDQAKDAYRQAVTLDPRNVAARINLGRLLLEERQLHAAETQFRAVLEHDSRNATALFNLGVTLEDLGRRDEAIEAYRNAVRVDPAYANAHFNLARMLEQIGEVREAMRHLKTYRVLTGP